MRHSGSDRSDPHGRVTYSLTGPHVAPATQRVRLAAHVQPRLPLCDVMPRGLATSSCPFRAFRVLRGDFLRTASPQNLCIFSVLCGCLSNICTANRRFLRAPREFSRAQRRPRGGRRYPACRPNRLSYLRSSGGLGALGVLAVALVGLRRVRAGAALAGYTAPGAP
jgi:hypothetical protein